MITAGEADDLIALYVEVDCASGMGGDLGSIVDEVLRVLGPIATELSARRRRQIRQAAADTRSAGMTPGTDPAAVHRESGTSTL